jgi:xanthine dehydrogenase accessory factor
MHDRGQTAPGLREKPVLVLGTDDIASAAGHALASAGVPVLLVRDPEVPVLRRAASFDDALELGSVRLDGVTGYAAHPLTGSQAHAVLTVTGLPSETLLDPALIDGVIDARVWRGQIRPDLRRDLGFAIGVGPGFTAGANVDIAVETAPKAAGLIVREGTTRPPPAESSLLVGTEGQCLVRAPRSGLWWTFREVGETVEKDAVVGLCAGRQVAAPLTGSLSGLVRRGTELRAGMLLLEVDPRGEDERRQGIPPLSAKIAAATVTAVHELWQSPPRGPLQEVLRWLITAVRSYANEPL